MNKGPEPPFDLEAEKRLLGCVLLRPALLDQLLGKVEYGDFYAKPIALMWAAATDLLIDSQPIQPATIARRMSQEGLSDFGGVGAIAACMEGVSPDEADFWVKRVIDMRKRRVLHEAAVAAAEYAQSETLNPDESYSRLAAILERGESGEDETTVAVADDRDALQARFDRYLSNPDGFAGLATGWMRFDKILDGLRPGSVTAVYGRTSAYKSFFVQNLGWHLAREGVPGAWFTTETPRLEVEERLVQFETGVNISWARRKGELTQHAEALHSAASLVCEYPIWLNERSRLDVEYVKGVVSRLRRQKKIEYVIIDLVTHVHGRKRGDTEDEEFVAQQLKDIAKREQVAIIGTLHVRKADRPFGQKEEKGLPWIPLDDIKGSSSFSQDADTAISLMVVNEKTFAEPDYYPLKWSEIREAQDRAYWNGTPLNIYAAVTKHRHGSVGHIPFQVDLARGGIMTPAEDDR